MAQRPTNLSSIPTPLGAPNRRFGVMNPSGVGGGGGYDRGAMKSILPFGAQNTTGGNIDWSSVNMNELLGTALGLGSMVLPFALGGAERVGAMAMGASDWFNTRADRAAAEERLAQLQGTISGYESDLLGTAAEYPHPSQASLNAIFRGPADMDIEMWNRMFPRLDVMNLGGGNYLDLTLGESGLQLSPLDTAAMRGDVASTIGRGVSDLSATDQYIRQLLTGSQLAPGTLAGQVDMPGSNLQDILAGSVAGIGQASAARQALATQELASRASQYGGLEGLQGAMSGIGYEEGARRGTESLQEAGRIRALESEIEQANARIQSELALGEAGINRDLLTTLAGETGGLARARADLASVEAGLIPDIARAGTEQDKLRLALEDLNTARMTSDITRMMGMGATQMDIRGGRAQALKDAALYGLQTDAAYANFLADLIQKAGGLELGYGSLVGGSGLYQQPTASLLPLLPYLYPPATPGTETSMDFSGLGGGLGTAAGMGLAAAGGGGPMTLLLSGMASGGLGAGAGYGANMLWGD